MIGPWLLFEWHLSSGLFSIGWLPVDNYDIRWVLTVTFGFSTFSDVAVAVILLFGDLADEKSYSAVELP